MNQREIVSETPFSSFRPDLSSTGAKLAATPGGRHHLPHQPGIQWHSPVAAWQPSAWTQSHLFRQPGPNMPICTCEQTPTGKESSGGSLQHRASSVRVTQNATLTMCWHGKDKRGTRPKALMRAHRRWGKRWKAGQRSPWLSGLSWYVLLNYLSFDLCISLITERSVNM